MCETAVDDIWDLLACLLPSALLAGSFGDVQGRMRQDPGGCGIAAEASLVSFGDFWMLPLVNGRRLSFPCRWLEEVACCLRSVGLLVAGRWL